MKRNQWKPIVINLKALLMFLCAYILVSAVLALISILMLFVFFANPNNSDLGRVAEGAGIIVYGTIIGMASGLIVMYTYDRFLRTRIHKNMKSGD